MASCILWRRCPPCGRWSCCWDEIGKNPGLADTSPKATMRQTRIRFDEAIGMRCGLTGWSVDPFCKILFEFCRKTGSSTCGDIAVYLFFSHAPQLPQSVSLSCPLLTQDLFLSLSSCFSVIAPMIRTDRFRFRKIGHSRKKHFEGISQSNSLAYCGSIKCTYKWINFLEPLISHLDTSAFISVSPDKHIS